jgi:hypothetical protein
VWRKGEGAGPPETEVVAEAGCCAGGGAQRWGCRRRIERWFTVGDGDRVRI